MAMVVKLSVLAALAACAASIAAEEWTCGPNDVSCSAPDDALKADAMLQRQEATTQVSMTSEESTDEDCSAWGCSCQGLRDVHTKDLNVQVGQLLDWFGANDCKLGSVLGITPLASRGASLSSIAKKSTKTATNQTMHTLNAQNRSSADVLGHPVTALYKTNPDESTYYNKCSDLEYEPILTEAECVKVADELDGLTYQHAGTHGHWPPGCFRYSGVAGGALFFNPHQGTGYAGHVMICKRKPDYKTNPDSPAYYKQCEDPFYEPIVTEVECKVAASAIEGVTYAHAGSHAHWPPACFRYGWNAYFNTNTAGTGHTQHPMICRKKSLGIDLFSSCAAKKEGDMCSIIPGEQLWKGPTATNVGGIQLASSFVWDGDECKQKCQAHTQCKGLKYTEDHNDFTQEGHNCIIYSDQTDTSSCACSSWMSYTRVGSQSPPKYCSFWGDPHYSLGFNRGYFDFQTIGLFDVARSSNGNVVVQNFQCEYNNNAYVAVAVGVAVQTDGKTFYFGPNSVSSTMEGHGFKIEVGHKNVHLPPYMYFDAHITMAENIASSDGVCGSSDSSSLTPKPCADKGLFSDTQLQQMCEICTGNKPAQCDYSCTSAAPAPQPQRGLVEIEQTCHNLQSAQEKCCWLDDDFAYKSCVEDACASDDTDANVLTTDAIEVTMHHPPRTCRHRDGREHLECMPHKSKRCTKLGLWH